MNNPRRNNKRSKKRNNQKNVAQVNNQLPSKDEIKEIIDWIQYSNKRKKYHLFLTIWIYVLLRIFISDIDLNILSGFVELDARKYVLFRFLIFSLIILQGWIRVGNKRFWKNIGLFFLFPFFPILFSIFRYFIWKLPEKLIKSKKHYLLLSYIDILILFMVRFKKTILRMIIFVFSILGMVYFQSYWLIVPCIGFILLLILHIVDRYNEISAPVRLFHVNVKQVNLNFSKKSFNKQLKGLSKNKKKKKEVKISQMEYFLLIHTFSEMLNQKVNDILSSKSYFKSFVIKAILTLILSVFLVSFLNYTLFRFDPKHFSFDGQPKYFNFLYYSFFTIFPDGVNLEPVSILSQSIKMIGVLFGVAINIVVLVVYVTVINDKYKENLGKLSVTANEYSKDISEYFEEKYDKDMIEGYQWLKRTGSGLTEFLDQIKKLLKSK